MALTVRGERISVRVYDSRIATWGEPGGMTWSWVDNLSDKVERRARRMAPVSSGRLASSIRHSVTPLGKNGCIGTVRATAPYARFVHEGTGIYGPEHTPIFSTNPRGFVFASSRWPQYETTGHVPKTFRFFSTRGQWSQPFLARALEEQFIV
jgi:hypothetical protein